MASYQSKRSNAAKGNPVSLFPFLAVLLCTMGSLLGVLLIMADMAKKQVAQKAVQAQSEQQSKQNAPIPEVSAKTAIDSNQPTASEVQSEIEQKKKLLAEINEKTESIREIQTQMEQQLTDSRLRLSGIESSIETFKSEYEQLQSDAQKLAGQLELFDLQFLKEESIRLEKELQGKKQELNGLKEKNSETRPGLAVIPHKGQYNTSRYPIYVICTNKGVVLQPEGIVLSEGDFACNLSLGSPLEAAMRAKREYLLRQGAFDPSKGEEPYPLILVRPDGVEYYYAARAAIGAFGNDFGYKLVDSKQADSLVYPPVDPEMTLVIQKAIDSARLNIRAIARMAPATEDSPNGPVAYRVTGSGSREAVSLDKDSRVAQALRRSSPSSAGLKAGQTGTGNSSDSSNLAAGGNGSGYNRTGHSNSVYAGNNGTGTGTGIGTGVGMGTGTGTNSGGTSQSTLAGGQSSSPDGVYLPMTAPEDQLAENGSVGAFGGLADAERIEPVTNARRTDPGLPQENRTGNPAGSPMIAFPGGPYGTNSNDNSATSGTATNSNGNSAHIASGGSGNPIDNLDQWQPAGSSAGAAGFTGAAGAIGTAGATGIAGTAGTNNSNSYASNEGYAVNGNIAENRGLSLNGSYSGNENKPLNKNLSLDSNLSLNENPSLDRSLSLNENPSLDRNLSLNENPSLNGNPVNSSAAARSDSRLYSGTTSSGIKQLVSDDKFGSADNSASSSDTYNQLMAPPELPEGYNAAESGTSIVPPGVGIKSTETANKSDINQAYASSAGQPIESVTPPNDLPQLPPGNYNKAPILDKQNEHAKLQKSLAQRLGPDWAVPEMKTSAMSISRAIGVEVYPDKFIVRPAVPGGKSQTVPIYGSAANSVEMLVRTVRGQTAQWGEPGAGMYWKPYLKVIAVPGAQQQLSELKAALDNSGVEIQ